MVAFKPAVKAESKLRMAISGPSGTGKTYSAFSIATTLAAGKSIAVVDTEHGSASKYADLFTFDVLELDSFHPDRFVEAIVAAVTAGYGVLVIDSLSHAWNGRGGLLEVVDGIAKRSKSGNTYMAWAEGTPIQNRLIDAITRAPLHVIVTMRSKTEYVVETNERGKSAPRKVGMAPVQREGMEYEFDISMEMDHENVGVVVKSRCPTLSGAVIPKPGAQMAETLAEWLHGAPVSASPAPSTTKAPMVTGSMGERQKELRAQPEPPRQQPPAPHVVEDADEEFEYHVEEEEGEAPAPSTPPATEPPGFMELLARAKKLGVGKDFGRMKQTLKDDRSRLQAWLDSVETGVEKQPVPAY